MAFNWYLETKSFATISRTTITWGISPVTYTIFAYKSSSIYKRLISGLVIRWVALLPSSFLIGWLERWCALNWWSDWTAFPHALLTQAHRNTSAGANNRTPTLIDILLFNTVRSSSLDARDDVFILLFCWSFGWERTFFYSIVNGIFQIFRTIQNYALLRTLSKNSIESNVFNLMSHQ